MYAWGIDENYLPVSSGFDTTNAMPRRLRPARRDADFLTDQVIEKGRFADVGTAYEGNETCFHGLSPSFSASMANILSAACCSAFFREDPTPSQETGISETLHSTQKLWSCG